MVVVVMVMEERRNHDIMVTEFVKDKTHTHTDGEYIIDKE